MKKSNKKRSSILLVTIMVATVLLASMLVGFTTAKENKNLSVKNINLTVTDCNVVVKTHSDNVINSSFASDEFQYEFGKNLYTLTATQNGATMDIELKPADKSKKSDTKMVTIYIPNKEYNKIVVVGNGAGISLPAVNANFDITNNKGAISVSVSDKFKKNIDFTSIEGSGSLALSPLMDNYTLKMEVKNSAVSVSPELPKYTHRPQYETVKGDGAAKINLKIEKSSFSVNIFDQMHTFTIKDKMYYLVDSEEHLRLIGTKDYPLSANYMLNRDVDLKKLWIPIGNNDAEPFTGIFNGNGFTIKNVTIDDQEGSYKYLGFFGLVKGGTIHNVTLENVSIKTAKKSDVVISPDIVAADVFNGKMTDCVVK